MSTTATDLTKLIHRVADGDRQAFAQLYAATSAKLYGIVLRILKRPDLTDEVVQEAYVRIWSHAYAFDPAKASPITWMATIARNRAIDEVRRAKPLSLDDTPSAMDVADPSMSASEMLEQKTDIARLHKCIDSLEPDRRDIVKLAYLNGLSREELSHRFGQPVPTIKTWLHRSLKKLKLCLMS